METPLINSTPAAGFIGKSYNKHPHLFNQPLRLTEEELNNPILILNDFFQTYHLNETREVLWQWLTAVISSQSSISSEPLERSNHFYFYEKLEEVIEGAFVMKTNQPAAELNTTSKDSVNSIRPIHPETTAVAGEIFNKGKRLIEYVNDDPLFVIKEVFNPGKWSINYLKELVEIGLISEDDAYSDSDDRQNLVNFKDHLLLLVESLYIINLQRISDSAKKEWSLKVYTPHLLSEKQVANPTEVIVMFFEKYPMVYIMRELEDLLEAGISHTGPWKEEITCPWHVFDTYRNVLCLIKSAEQFLIKDFSTHSDSGE
ncbi:hypothetical protein A4H97_33850 [Niastella yeongjuensis]|uniref:Uncharacterized protein n=1 Tax=Niastella yeongjuensis TaxID=354355 RepID=A0A1V9EBZ2_9BACT|nr:hypothetical protein [Niastella yeongjuensis]OQP43612.1 hypothetical protein A4H97_33850 [Niastella yeongjuensis]SEP29043.1 hypothetical protein SAMN05660816_05072 [Niastella yeongjuensis]